MSLLMKIKDPIFLNRPCMLATCLLLYFLEQYELLNVLSKYLHKLKKYLYSMYI